MSVFDNMRDKLLSYFNTNNKISSEWIKINDKKTSCGWTIEDFPYNIGVDENLTEPHCWKCVTVNQCWFKNEEEKKPEHFDYSKYSYTEIPKSIRGLYHPNCHCKENAINVPRLNDIEVLDVRANFNDFFKRKKGVFYGIGYTPSDEKYLMDFYVNEVKNSYRAGNYKVYKHRVYGFQINIIITIYGKGQFQNKSHEFKTGLFIFPNGKLRIATVFAGGN